MRAGKQILADKPKAETIIKPQKSVHNNKALSPRARGCSVSSSERTQSPQEIVDEYEKMI